MGNGLLRSATRVVRRTYHRLRSRGVLVVYDTRYQRGVFGVPLDPLRGEKVLATLEEAGFLRRDDLSAPRPASLQNLLRVHTDGYLRRTQDPETLSRILGVPVPAAEVEGILDLQRLMVGGSIQATRLALRTGGVAVHLGGGFHHATADAGLGFCVFNDVAVAVVRLRARGFAEPILVVDLDLHDGNGTRAVFAGDSTVHTYSLHNEHWGETEAVESTAIALGADVDDGRYLATLRATLPPLFERFRPGLVVYVAGTDGAADDALGNWRLSAGALLERDRLVTSLARPPGRELPFAVVLAGGYGRRAWRHTARYALWLAAGREIQPPDEEDLALKRFRRLGALSRAEAGDSDLPFTLAPEDLMGLVPGASPPARFLGLSSRHDVELLLERSGILAQLRAKGFRRLRVDLDGRGGGVETLRVVADDGPEELLVELRAERSRGAMPGMEVVSLDWLLLQNPREDFSARRPRLPGQQHPGLGLLRDIMGWLVVTCEAHGLDGIFFVAAHYHIAVQSRRLVRPLRPMDEARLRALADACEGLTLPEATAAIAEGRVVDARTGAAAPWTPVPTVLPVSERLRALVSGPQYEQAAAEERALFAFRIAAAPPPPPPPDADPAPVRSG